MPFADIVQKNIKINFNQFNKYILEKKKSKFDIL